MDLTALRTVIGEVSLVAEQSSNPGRFTVGRHWTSAGHPSDFGPYDTDHIRRDAERTTSHSNSPFRGDRERPPGISLRVPVPRRSKVAGEPITTRTVCRP